MNTIDILNSKLKVTILFSVFIMFCSANIYANSAGTIEFSSSDGKIQIISKTTKTIKTPESGIVTVNYGDLVRTDAKAKIELTMLDGNFKIDIYPNTVYRIVQPETKKNQLLLFLGKALFSINKFAKNVLGESFEVKGKFSTMGVKGTTFIAEETPTASTLTVVEGDVEFFNNNTPEEKVSVTTSQRSTIRKNQQPTAPKDISQTEVKQIIETEATQDPEVPEAPEEIKKEEKEGAGGTEKTGKTAEKVTTKEETIQKIDEIIQKIDEENKDKIDIKKSNTKIELILDLPQ